MVSADLSPPFVCRKITPERSITPGVPAFPIFPCKTWRTVYKRNKKLARRFDGRVTLLAGPTILHRNTLTRPAEATRSIPKRGYSCMRELYCQLLARAKRRIKLISQDFALSLVLKVRLWVGFRWWEGGRGRGRGNSFIWRRRVNSPDQGVVFRLLNRVLIQFNV